MMRIIELRAYTLRSREALDCYVNETYPRHLGSFPPFGIQAHENSPIRNVGLWQINQLQIAVAIEISHSHRSHRLLNW
jgi:hypothetical protein